MFQLRANYEYCITKSEAGCIVNQSLNNLYTTPIVIELCDDISLCESSTELCTIIFFMLHPMCIAWPQDMEAHPSVDSPTQGQ